ncbi:hypothetical protein AB0P17_29740 [Streptomyces sp. NPDC088124]|uniref:hypothetical protein n=1 Tax=Streptomyces sp. NPDC088124 TaxID=3154654 RepID=UPI00342A034B
MTQRARHCEPLDDVCRDARNEGNRLRRYVQQDRAVRAAWSCGLTDVQIDAETALVGDPLLRKLDAGNWLSAGSSTAPGSGWGG